MNNYEKLHPFYSNGSLLIYALVALMNCSPTNSVPVM